MLLITITIGTLLGILIRHNWSRIKSLFNKNDETKISDETISDYEKVVKVINSCNSWSQHRTTLIYVNKFLSKWKGKSGNLGEELQILLSIHFSPNNKKLKKEIGSLSKLIDWLPEPQPEEETKTKSYGT